MLWEIIIYSSIPLSRICVPFPFHQEYRFLLSIWFGLGDSYILFRSKCQRSRQYLMTSGVHNMCRRDLVNQQPTLIYEGRLWCQRIRWKSKSAAKNLIFYGKALLWPKKSIKLSLKINWDILKYCIGPYL